VNRFSHSRRNFEKFASYRFSHSRRNFEKFEISFILSLKDEKDLRKANLTLKPVDTKTSGHRFRTSKLAELNAEYLTLSAKYRKLQENVITELVATAGNAPILFNFN
jgi:DNA mismatch repair ATPase MutS